MTDTRAKKRRGKNECRDGVGKGNKPAVKTTRSLPAVRSLSLSRHQTVARFKHGRGDTSWWQLDSYTRSAGGDSFAYLHRAGRAGGRDSERFQREEWTRVDARL